MRECLVQCGRSSDAVLGDAGARELTGSRRRRVAVLMRCSVRRCGHNAVTSQIIKCRYTKFVRLL
jgi:hypothetical protein